jgi:hypothetical protein
LSFVVSGRTGTIKRRKSLVHRLILNDQTFLSPKTTSVINDVSSFQKEIYSYLSCSTSTCLRNQTLIKTNDLLRCNTYANDSEHRNYLTPLEHPFPFLHSFEIKNTSFNPLRMKFYHQSQMLLPEQLPILLTISSSINHFLVHDMNINANNDLIEQLIHFAYTKWTSKTKQYQFDRYLFHYHQQILAPLLKYAHKMPNHRQVHVIERHINRYHSELPFTFGYVLAPSMSVFNDTYYNATDDDRRESMTIMNLFANLIHTGYVH